MSCYIISSVNRVDKRRQDKNEVENEKTAKIVINMDEKYKNYRNKNTN